jgi:hypothetical protein
VPKEDIVNKSMAVAGIPPNQNNVFRNVFGGGFGGGMFGGMGRGNIQ